MKRILLLIFSILIFCSCGVNRVYTPANYGATKKYVAKPIYKDTIVSANYISLSFSDGKHPHVINTRNSSPGLGYSSKNTIADTKTIGNINYHTSTSYKKSNFYYGIGFSYGKYNFKNSLDDIIVENESRSFYIINPKIGLSFKKISSNFDFHFIGLELNYNYENGAYQDKLSEITPSSSIRVVNEESLFSLNLFSELLYKVNTNNSIGFGLYFGGIIGLNETKYNIKDNDGKGFGGFTFSYRLKKTTFSLVSESAAKNIQSINYGINYQF